MGPQKTNRASLFLDEQETPVGSSLPRGEIVFNQKDLLAEKRCKKKVAEIHAAGIERTKKKQSTGWRTRMEAPGADLYKERSKETKL